MTCFFYANSVFICSYHMKRRCEVCGRQDHRHRKCPQMSDGHLCTLDSCSGQPLHKKGTCQHSPVCTTSEQRRACELCSSCNHAGTSCPHRCTLDSCSGQPLHRHRLRRACALCSLFDHSTAHCPMRCKCDITSVGYHLEAMCPKAVDGCGLCGSQRHVQNRCPQRCLCGDSAHHLPINCPSAPQITSLALATEVQSYVHWFFFDLSRIILP